MFGFIDFERTLLFGVIGGIVGLVLSLVARTQKAAAPRDVSTGAAFIRYAPSVAWGFGLFIGAALIGFITLCLVMPFKTPGEFWGAMLGGTLFFSLSGVFVVLLFQMRVFTTDDGLEYQGIFGGLRSIDWTDIARVKCSQDGILKVVSKDNVKIKLQTLTQGRREVFAVLEENLPPGVAVACADQLQKFRNHLNRSSPFSPISK